MNCFLDSQLPKLMKRPLQQIWRDHLLMGAHQIVDNFDDAFFVFLYPEQNKACSNVVEQYKTCLSHNSSFQSWTLEELVSCLQKHSSQPWIQDFYDRYLDFSKLPI